MSFRVKLVTSTPHLFARRSTANTTMSTRSMLRRVSNTVIGSGTSDQRGNVTTFRALTRDFVGVASPVKESQKNDEFQNPFFTSCSASTGCEHCTGDCTDARPLNAECDARVAPPLNFNPYKSARYFAMTMILDKKISIQQNGCPDVNFAPIPQNYYL